jgi:hypothetical protein
MGYIYVWVWLFDEAFAIELLQFKIPFEKYDSKFNMVILSVPDEGLFQKRVVRTKFDIYVFSSPGL